MVSPTINYVNSQMQVTISTYLSTYPAASVNVTIYGGIHGTYTFSPSYVTFTQANRATPQNFTITVTNAFLFPTVLSVNGSSTDSIYNQASTLFTINGTSLCPNSNIFLKKE